MATPPKLMLESCSVSMIPCLSRLPVTALMKPCSVQLDAQAVSRYFTSVALASRNSKQLEIKPSVPADEDFPHQSDERTLQEEPEVSTGDQKMDTVTVEEIVILDSPKKTTVDEIIEISDSEDSVIEVETVSASKKKVNKPPPPISVPNTKSDIPPTSPKKTKIYEQVRFLCPKCKKHYVNKSSVSSHYAKAHNGSLRHSNIQQQVKKVYECLMCSVSFFNLINFQIHCDSIHNISIPVSELVTTKIDIPVEKENDTLPGVSSKVNIPVQNENVPLISTIAGESKDSDSTTAASIAKENCVATTMDVPCISTIAGESKDSDSATAASITKENCVATTMDVPHTSTIAGESKDSTTSASIVKENCVSTTMDISPKSDTEDNPSNPDDQKNDTVENVDVKHYCEKCDMMFSSIDELVLHNKKTHLRQRNSTPSYKAQVNLEVDKKEINKYECSKCNRKFSSEADRNNHCKLDHNHLPRQQERGEFCCKYCHRYFKDVAQFFFHLGKEHAKIHENILEHSQHTVQEHATETSHCTPPDVDLTEDNVSGVDVDSAVGSVTSSHDVDISPQLITENSKPCSKETKTPYKDRFTCSICKKKFTNKQSFQKHISIYHNKSTQRYIVQVNEGRDASGKFMCLICHRQFKSRNGANVHYSIIHDKHVAQAATPKVQRYISTSSGMVECTVCHKHFLSKKSAHDHYNKFHSFSDKPVAQVMPQMNDLLNPIELGKPQNSAMKSSRSTTVPFETIFIESLDPSDVAKMKSNKTIINDQKNVVSSLSDKQTFEKFKCLNCCQQFDTNVALANHHCSELSHEINHILQSEPNTISVCQICCENFMTDLQDIFCPTCKLEVDMSENKISDRPGTSNDRFDGQIDFLDSKVDIVDHTLHETSDTSFLSSQEEVEPTKSSNPETLQSMISDKADYLLPSQATVEPTKSKNPVTQNSIVFQCEKCCRLFMNKFAKSKHVCKLNNPLAYRYEHENLPCIYCKELCANIYQAAQHRRQKHAYVCLICKIDFKTELILETHNNSQIHLEMLSHECSICGRKFKSVKECILHVKRCHNISSTKSALELCKTVVNRPKILGNIFCPFCEFNFKTFTILNYHFIKKHQMIQCLTCDNYFIFDHSSDMHCIQCSDNATSDASNKEQRLECRLVPDKVNDRLEPTKKRKQKAVEQKAEGDLNEGCCRTRGLENWQVRKKMKSDTVRRSQEHTTEATTISNPILINNEILCNTCQNPITTGDKCNFCSTDISQPLVTEQNICITCKNPITIGDKCDFCSTDLSQPSTTEPNIPDTNQNPVVSTDKYGSFTNVKSISNNCPTPVAMHRVIKICVACGKLVSSGDICQFCSGNSSKSYDITVSQSQSSPAGDMPTSKSHTNLSSNSVYVPASNAYIRFSSKSQSILAPTSYCKPNLNKCKTCGKMLAPQGECLSCKTKHPHSVPSPSTSGQSGSSTNNPVETSSNSSTTQKSFKILGFQCSRCQIWVKSIPELSIHLKTVHDVNMKVGVATSTTFGSQ